MEAMPWVEIGIIAALICCSAFFSGSETALTAISRARIYKLAKEGNQLAMLVEKLRERKESLIGGILLGNNLVNIAAASLATTVAISVWGVEWGPLYATIIMTLVVLIFAEILPKTIAINNAEKMALIVARPIQIIMRVFAPITNLIQYFIAAILNFFGISMGDDNLSSSHEVIKGTIEMHHEEGGVEKANRDMLGSILDLDDRDIEEVMIHRKQVNAINISDDPEDIIQQIINSQHSRLPLYKNSHDNIIGVLHVKDMLPLVKNQSVGITREMIRRRASRPWFVPDTITLAQQLFAFRSKRKHFAFVVDEYGDWQGIVTLEDIIEEIVGEIDDEHDIITIDDIMPFGKNAYRVGGTVTIRDLNRHLDWELPDNDASTVAGLVLHESRVIPEEGAIFEFYNMRFEVIEREGNQITKLQIEKLTKDNEGDE